MNEPADADNTGPEQPESEHDGSGSSAPDILLSDAERLHALTVLGDHYATGRLDDSEFHSRSGAVAGARTLSDVRPSFADLPGGLPLEAIDGRIVQAATTEGGELVPTSSSGTSSPALREAEAELDDLRKRGKKVESSDGIVIGVTLVAFLVLQFAVGWSYAWIVWPSLILTLSIPRMIFNYSDEDEEAYEEIKEADQKARKERLKAAHERIRELGDGREQRD